jgi:hypothetical protein
MFFLFFLLDGWPKGGYSWRLYGSTGIIHYMAGVGCGDAAAGSVAGAE